MVFRGTTDNAKTVLCTRFLSSEGCRFGDRCNFAHGDEEIRSRPADAGPVQRACPPCSLFSAHDSPALKQQSHRAGFGVDAPFGRAPHAGQFGGRSAAWGAGAEGLGPVPYAGGTPHWSAQGNGGGWTGGVGGSGGGGGGGGSIGIGGSQGGNPAALHGAHAGLPSVALRNLEPGNHGWTQHTAPEGYCYFYNSHTGVSQWERPLALDFPISGGSRS